MNILQNLHPILQDEATNDAHLYFPRLTRWTRMNLMEKVNRGMYNNVSIARVQIELQRLDNLMCPWDSYLEIQQGLDGYEGTPLVVARWFSQKKVPLHVPSLPHAWYLGEWCSLQETQLTQKDIDTSVDPAWRLRVVDIDGTNRLFDVPRLSDVPGVPSTGLNHDTEING
ncbi:hypothetical protein GIB67_037266 [Kingdonia uniflora]|uniref:Uncharacterized protein n=1 Tax=Kingdonia uniflora TaxID=39325 RepID=A0A7J7MS52_9MAGN|nr:hypothetical protein GIB67_037266 [Kingdonia uniflora]